MHAASTPDPAAPAPSPPELSMLWEPTDAGSVLAARFGLHDASAASAHVTRTLAEHWDLDVRSCDRVVMSDQNLLAWVSTDVGRFVVKACADAAMFDHLGAVAEVVAVLGEQGLPVAAPVRTATGASRALVSGAVPLTVMVMPEVPGDLVDAADPPSLRATGATLAHVHRALARSSAVLPPGPGPLAATDAGARPPIRCGPGQRARAPRAAARLDGLLRDLPGLDVPPQLVHSDVRGANVLVKDRRVTALLDHDSMTVGHRVDDLAAGAVKIATRFRTWDPPAPGAREHLVAGYRSVQPLTPIEERWLEAMVLAHGLGQIPPGADPAGWAEAVESGL